jgi:hypothetical protein
MPKTEIDYANTVIYKITCIDKAITDVYVGHTTNFVQRKHQHKQNCKNIKATNHTNKLYEVIRTNGGWENWQMEIINYFNCADHYAARKKEQEYFIALNATLNSIEPLPKSNAKSIKNPTFFCNTCNTCNVTCNNLQLFEKHNKTTAHCKKMPFNAQNEIKNAAIFFCDKCDFKCCKQSNYDKHLLTSKHKNLTKPNIYNSKNAPNHFECASCKKIYKHASTLSAHKKICTQPIPSLPSPPPALALVENALDVQTLSLLVVELVKSNSDLQKQMADLYKTANMTNISHVNHTNNSHNKTFNLQFFLNEKCKDAMNIKDFVNSMTLELEDLEEVGKLGYVEGISNIIIRKLNALDVYKRPIHCSDAKREIMFVKDDNIWEKENSTYDKLRKAIKSVTYKNSALLGPWSEKYPNCLNNQHHLNDVYVQMLGQAMGGRESFLESENKIMKKIAKVVLIEKSTF